MTFNSNFLQLDLNPLSETLVPLYIATLGIQKAINQKKNTIRSQILQLIYAVTESQWVTEGFNLWPNAKTRGPVSRVQ